MSRINCEGIAILNENEQPSKKVRCLMQGDVPYNALQNEINFKAENPFEYLIAPHHGSEMECTLLSKPSVKKGTAIICCTNNETDIENRPAEKHLEALNKCYKAVLPTSYAPCYIQIDLNKESNIVLK